MHMYLGTYDKYICMKYTGPCSYDILHTDVEEVS